MRDKYIFIDFDGVMTSMIETPGSYINHKFNEYGISVTPLKLILELINMTNSKVVISSNWRRFAENGQWNYHGLSYKNPLPKLIDHLKKSYIGTLPLDRHISKSQALELWFEKQNLNPNDVNYVIFDDDSAEGFFNSIFAEHFILTNPQTGITKDDVEKAKGILNNG